MPTIKITIPGPPMGKPRQTRSDKWKQRPCVMKYRAWADLARLCVQQQVGKLPDPDMILAFSIAAFFEIPESYSSKKRLKLLGERHRVKPDGDNALKAAMDVLFSDDQAIADGSFKKRWAETSRMEITIEYEEETDVDSRSGGATGPSLEGSRKAKVRTRVESPRTRRGTGHESVPVEHILA